MTHSDQLMERMYVIPLTQGYTSVVDETDYKKVMQYKWYAHRNGRNVYAVRQLPRNDSKQVRQSLHTFLVEATSVDHKNRDGLDNRRANLRLAIKSQNMSNRRKQAGTSQYRGVTWNKNAKKWKAQIQHEKQRYSLGFYTNEEDAANAYDRAACYYFGEFANPNFGSNGKRTYA